jgi:hypothetical protein
MRPSTSWRRKEENEEEMEEEREEALQADSLSCCQKTNGKEPESGKKACVL